MGKQKRLLSRSDIQAGDRNVRYVWSGRGTFKKGQASGQFSGRKNEPCRLQKVEADAY